MIKNKVAPLTAAFLAFCWMFFFFHPVILHPNSHLFNSEGDGIKAFYAFADHIKNDSSYHQFQHMNYPYGQTHIFTDGQTGIANALKFLSQFFPFFQTHCIGIYNYLVIFSFVFAAFFIACILQYFNLPFLFKVAGGLCITILSPQIWRISGHPTLSYALFFPLSWYLLLLLIDSGFKKRYIFTCILNTTFWFFVHPYLGMITTFFYAAFFFITVLQKIARRDLSLRNTFMFLAIIFMPVILLKTYTAIYDHHLFRSEYPWGFWIFYTSPLQVFLPHSPPLSLLMPYFMDITGPDMDMEKFAYVGMAVDLILLIALFRIVRHVLRKEYFLAFNPALPKHIGVSFWASVLILLFAMCIPFKWGLHQFVEYVDFLRQFRSLGRFAWAFYYVGTVYAVYLFYLLFRFLRMKNLRALSNTFAIFFFCMFAVEGHADFKERSMWAVIPRNYFNEAELTPEFNSLIGEVNKIKDQYQCIVTLPFFHVGSENFGADFTRENLTVSTVISYWCNMPLMASSAARSPILESKNIMQFFSPPYIKKEIQKDLPSKKDFLILWNKEPLKTEEKHLLDRSAKLFDNGKYELWSISYSEVFSNNAQKLWDEYSSIKNALKKNGNFETTGDADVLVYYDFDSLNSDITYRGGGALKANKIDMTTFLKSSGALHANQDYTVSYWYYNKGELRNQILCGVEECDAGIVNCRWAITWDPISSMVIDGDWSLVEKNFSIKDSTEQIQIFVQDVERKSQDIYIDEFLLRPSNVDVYKTEVSKGDTILFKNNRWITGRRGGAHGTN